MSIARRVPTNYILLLIFTLCESFLVAAVCVFTTPKIVFMATVFTLALCISLTIYAMTTDEDFTICGGLLFVCLIVLVVAGIFLIFTDNNVVHIFFCMLGIILFSIYLIYDTQLIVGGKRYEFSIDDYIIGALSLYLDIINIFLYIIEILVRTN